MMTPKRTSIFIQKNLSVVGHFSTALALVTSISTASEAASTCVVPTDCISGFCVDGFCCNAACNGACDACSAAKKGNGIDGECGLATEGTTCKGSYCNGDIFSYVGPSKCNASGTCIEPAPVDCSGNNPCLFNLCSDTGCETSLKLDGAECGAGMSCQNGVCGESMASSSSSGAGGAGGSGGNGGNGGMNAASSSSSSGNAGSGGMGGSAEVGGSSSSGTTDPYPPSTGKGCTCNVSDNNSLSGSAGVFLSLFALVARFMRRNRSRSQI